MQSTPSPLENARSKVWEADYFSHLIMVICVKKRGIVPPEPIRLLFGGPDGLRQWEQPDISVQIAYLLSAFLNSSYSVTEYLRRDQRFREAIIEFLKKHSFFYGSGPNGGIRTRATHFSIVRVPYIGNAEPVTHPTFSDSLVEMFAEDDYQEETERASRITLAIRNLKTLVMSFPRKLFTRRARIPDAQEFYKFYLSDRPKQDSVDELCTNHVLQLFGLIATCEAIANGGHPAVAPVPNPSTRTPHPVKHLPHFFSPSRLNLYS